MSNDTAVRSVGLHNASTSLLSLGVRFVGDKVGVDDGDADGVDVGEAVVAMTVPHSARRVLDVVVVVAVVVMPSIASMKSLISAVLSALAVTVVMKAAVASRDVKMDFILMLRCGICFIFGRRKADDMKQQSSESLLVFLPKQYLSSYGSVGIR